MTLHNHYTPPSLIQKLTKISNKKENNKLVQTSLSGGFRLRVGYLGVRGDSSTVLSF